jgi:hypothetical protein
MAVDPREAEVPMPVATSAPTVAEERAPEPAPVAKTPSVPPPSRAVDPEAILVLDATRALHRDHDAKRALKLLVEYRRRFPRGDLQEESLALAIEAKSTRNDRGAAVLADEYLLRYPGGRFREEALRAHRRFAR